MILLRLIPIFFTLLFVLSRSVDVKILKHEDLTVKMNFNIFALLLTDDKTQKKAFLKAIGFIRNARSFYKPIEYLVSKSEVQIHNLNTNPPTSAYTPLSVIKNVSVHTSMKLLVSYLELNCKKLKFSHDTFIDKKHKDKSSFDILIHFSLWYLIISALFLLYYIVKNKLKRIIKNV